MINLKNNEHIKEIFEKYSNSFFIALGIIGVLMLLLGEAGADNSEKETADNSDTELYRSMLETELKTILSSVHGAGEVELMITLESGQENIYAWYEKSESDEQTNSSEKSEQVSVQTSFENQVIMTGSGSRQYPLVEKVMQPAVQGVVVVCSGADDIEVATSITTAVSVALDIPTNRVCVIKMK